MESFKTHLTHFFYRKYSIIPHDKRGALLGDRILFGKNFKGKQFHGFIIMHNIDYAAVTK